MEHPVSLKSTKKRFSTAGSSDRICIIHFDSTIDDGVNPLTEHSFTKIKKTAIKRLQMPSPKHRLEALVSNLPDTFNEAIHGSHRRCYQLFTNISKLTKKLSTSLSDIEPNAPSTSKQSYSSTDSTSGTVSLLTDKCIFCDRDIVKVKGVKQQLIKCITKYSENLIKSAALEKCDETLLCKVQDEDLVAREAVYHGLCLRNYTKSRSQKALDDASEYIYKYVEEHIMTGHNVEQLTVLRERYLTYLLKNYPTLYNENYKTYELKDKLVKHFAGKIHFWQPSNGSEVVYAADTDKGQEIEMMGAEEGKTAMKRIRVECGVCKATRFYSIHRGITRIAGVVACEACRQFYQRFKKQPWILNCNKGGRCFRLDETPKNKCKACWVAHIICRCPVPMSLYNHLVGYLPTDLKSKMAGRPPTADEVPEKERGGLGLEIYKDNDWVDVTNKEEVESLLRNDEGNDTDEANEPDLDMEFEAEELVVDDSGMPESSASSSTSETKVNRAYQRKGKKGLKSDAEPDEQTMSTLMEDLQVSQQLKFMENFNPKTSERVKRKKKKVQYFTSTGRTKNQTQLCFHGPDGTIIGSGKDLCDCLTSDCPGCHYPCPKCGSGKCGTECRINRKWYYEKVEVEGTKLTWTNEFIKKK